MRVEVAYGRKTPESARSISDDIFEVEDQDLAVGDIVLLPGTWRAEMTGYSEPREATVTNIGSTYTGPVGRILRVVERTEQSSAQAR
jgi:hypothetical protein